MAPDANPPARGRADPADEARLDDAARSLAERVEAAVPGWIERLVVTRVREWSGHVSPEVAAEAVAAGEAARDDVVPRLRRLLETDIDEQRGNPLDLLRGATRHADAVLERAGMPAVQRDQFAERSFPSDRYDLMPATWADIDPSLHEPGITWGAAKAFVHKARRRAEGRK
ncbi:MAG TPA: hypothetical protein VFU14_06805 [Acidimicrobiales bacterium]|nr:hypothetical protein [Acidimicrobiales bacterium]